MRNDQFQDVAWTGERFVALGLSSILVSEDGLTWRGPAFSNGRRLAVGPLGIVAIDQLSGSHTSTDGLIWSTSADAFEVPGIGSNTVDVTDVVATDDGWLAVGREDPACNVGCGIEPVRAIVWTSSDGLRWTRVDNQASLRDAAMNAVARGGPGYVAVGEAGGHGAVWTSVDGTAWSRVSDARRFGPPADVEGVVAAAMSDVAGTGGLLVAVGQTYEGGTALAWWSTDGREWSRGSGDRFAGGQLFSVAAVPGGFLATGPSAAESCRGGIWSSTDGRSWTCIASDPLFEGFGPYAAAASPSMEIAVGLTSAGWDEAAGGGLPGAIWYRQIP